MEREVADILPVWLYVTSTLVLFAGNVIGAIFISEVEDISGLIGGMSCSMLNFFLPGLFYIITARNPNTSLKPATWQLVIAGLYSTYGLLVGTLCTVFRIYTIIDDAGEE